MVETATTRPPRRVTSRATPPPTLPNPSMATERPSQPEPHPARSAASAAAATPYPVSTSSNGTPSTTAPMAPGAARRSRNGAKSSSAVPISGPVRNRPAATSGRTSAQNRLIRASLAARSAGSPRTPALAPPTRSPSAANLYVIARASNATSVTLTPGASRVPPADTGTPGRSNTTNPGTEPSSTISGPPSPRPASGSPATRHSLPDRSARTPYVHSRHPALATATAR